MPGEAIARPAVAKQRLTVNPQGKVVYLLKTPYRDGTTHVAFEPLDFIARLAVLVPRPRVNQTRYHGVLAPNHRWCAQMTPSGRGRWKGSASAPPECSAIERPAAMTWARRLKRVFNIDVETCVRCGKAVRVIASIEEPALIERILEHGKGGPLSCLNFHITHRTTDQYTSPAVGHGFCHELIAEQRATERSAAIHHQHRAAAWERLRGTAGSTIIATSPPVQRPVRSP